MRHHQGHQHARSTRRLISASAVGVGAAARHSWVRRIEHRYGRDTSSRSKVQTLIPASWAAVGHGIPSVCSRHGQAATLRARTRFESAPAGWTYALIPLGLLVFLIVRAATRVVVDAPVWHYCDRCRRRRRQQRVWFGLLTAGGIAIPITALVTQADGPAATLLTGAGLIALIVGYLGLARARWEVIAQAQVTRDGHWIAVRDPAPEFDGSSPQRWPRPSSFTQLLPRARPLPSARAGPPRTDHRKSGNENPRSSMIELLRRLAGP